MKKFTSHQSSEVDSSAITKSNWQSATTTTELATDSIHVAGETVTGSLDWWDMQDTCSSDTGTQVIETDKARLEIKKNPKTKKADAKLTVKPQTVAQPVNKTTTIYTTGSSTTAVAVKEKTEHDASSKTKEWPLKTLLSIGLVLFIIGFIIYHIYKARKPTLPKP